MIVRTTDDITGTERDVSDGTWRSKRIILADDAVGFSFHETTIQAGSVNEFHYQYHVEAVWLVEGSGLLTNLETGEEHPLKARRSPAVRSTTRQGRTLRQRKSHDQLANEVCL